MKGKLQILLLLIAIVTFGCQDVVDIDTPTDAPQLVVDATINWQKGTPGNEQKIRLSMSTNYFSNVIPVVSGAEVFVQNSVGTRFDFIENPGTGDYICNTFIPEIDETYTLTINYNGDTLTATDLLKSVAPISRIEQETIPGIGEADDQIDVKAYFTDPLGVTNYYYFRYQSTITAIPEYDVFDDEFFQGNEVFGLYLNQELKPGDKVQVTVGGISEQYFNYLTILTTIAGNTGNPFATPPATLHSNIVNTTNPGRYVLGYFSLSEIDSQSYTVQ